ncbi:8770_t:CDS:2 [Scutellospora calospora]|uniref:8770_t:CDS:1 n=1 Tax=Scutellospora calospora TaxID=85575 RepID=A0ACA9JZ60_9GLOM|nr:8770_t:CDS:2 [Scutellospora calospora]
MIPLVTKDKVQSAELVIQMHNPAFYDPFDCLSCIIFAILPFMSLLITKVDLENFMPDPSKINEAIRLFFSGLVNLDYEPSYNDHIYFQYLSNSKDDIALLDIYHSEKIFDKYIIQVAEKSFTIVDHLFEIYRISNTHESSSSNANKCSWHIIYNYAYFIDYRDLRGFVEKVVDKVGKLYSEFIDIGFYKSHFSLQLLGSAKEDRVKRPAISSVKQGYCKLEDYLVQPKLDASEIWP